MQLFSMTAAPQGLTGFFPAVLVFFFLGYLFGSIPTGLWLCKLLHHIDIRQYGSGNIGATNVFRTVGPKTAALVLVCDMLKGIVPLYVAEHVLAGLPLAVAITALGALLGHNYSFLLRFRGGKGVATGLGLFLYMLPLSAGVGFLFWIVIVAVTRYVSLGSVIGALAAAVSAWLLGYPWSYAAFGTLAALFVIVRHKDNLKRLANGTESKIKPGHLNKRNTLNDRLEKEHQNMNEKSTFFLVREEILPEAIKKTIRVKEILKRGEVKTINEAVEKMGLSRSAYYKYKDYVFSFYEASKDKIITLSLLLEHKPGVLSKVLNTVAADSGSIMTINQGIPLQGVANTTISIETNNLTIDLEALLDKLRMIEGVKRLEVLGQV